MLQHLHFSGIKNDKTKGKNNGAVCTYTIHKKTDRNHLL